MKNDPNKFMRICITAKEAAEVLGIGYTKVLELAGRGLLPHARLGRRVVFRRDALEQWLNHQMTASVNNPAMTDFAFKF